MPIIISIVVFRGDLLDVIEFRDAAIHVFYSDGHQTLMHLIGTPGFFEFAREEGHDPRRCRNLAGIVHVSVLKDSISKAAIEAACARTPVQNDFENWNSYNWVCRALTGLHERSTAIDKMKNILREAEDEPGFTSEPSHVYRT
ncbi:hypothetical protein BJY00DRAFT_315697 [Aspergillus carlsbadensis]|nr:hypothetical protein BJY00DRAFT_315697 [Aspergillus carlsbadensis]